MTPDLVLNPRCVPRFDAEAHRYTLDLRSGARILDSVSQVIKAHGLMPPYAGDRREEGRAFHELTATDDAAPELIPEDAKDLADWRLYRDRQVRRVLAIELPLADPAYLYGGTLDRVMLETDGEEWVRDLKFGAPALWHRLQTAAYARLWALATDRPNWRPKRGVIYVHGGKLKVVDHPENPEDEIVFLGLRHSLDWRQRNA